MIIKIKDLVKTFDNKVIFNKLNFDIEKNEIICILGPSGCGKTTILNMISGLETFDSGEIIMDKDIKKSFVFQEDRLLAWKTVKDNISFVKQPKNMDNNIINETLNESELDNILEDVDLINFKNFYPNQLSGGMKQRVSIARAFFYDANLMLMDEPFNSLDIKLKYEIIKKLIKLWERKRNTIIFITHDIDEALLTGNRIAVLNGHPTTIKNIFLIDTPQRDRELTDLNLIEIREKILKILINYSSQ